MNLPKLRELPLSKGAHTSPDQGVCIMEVVSYVAGEPFSDHPQCACPVISEFLRRWNDDMNDTDRQMLKPLVPLLIGSRSTREIEQIRINMINDWCCRVNAPEWLDIAGLHKEAGEARRLGVEAPWISIKNAATAAYIAAATATTATAANAAATATTANAATDAAAYIAAATAARYACDAAVIAIHTYKKDILRPTVIKLQKSALKLVRDCLEIKASTLQDVQNPD